MTVSWPLTVMVFWFAETRFSDQIVKKGLVDKKRHQKIGLTAEKLIFLVVVGVSSFPFFYFFF